MLVEETTARVIAITMDENEFEAFREEEAHLSSIEDEIDFIITPTVDFVARSDGVIYIGRVKPFTSVEVHLITGEIQSWLDKLVGNEVEQE